ncbi:MAG: MgtC/SapB family protein [Candidatus Pacebacteria bacterium]|nr:MgtC/SapB family protein [Candidatus Paceibacterota bacterium]
MFGFEPFLQILLAGLLGALIGLERKSRKKEAGLRTFALVSLGCCLFAIIDIDFMEALNAPAAIGVVQAVAIGIGFLGSGIILQHKGQIEGLTTAAALWATAAVGIGVGMGFYSLTVFATFLVLLILSGFDWLEIKLFGQEADYEDK